jgi:iron complex outermembrane receptor protein
MSFRQYIALSLSGLFACAAAGAAEPAASRPSAPAIEQPVEKVTVSGQRLSDVDERRYSTAAKMVFGREDLDRYGDSSVAEVMKRLPGVTVAGPPGRGGDVRMRGLGQGYTQILINGEPAPRGFSLDSLTPDQVERIEVMRAAVAEHSARGIAGTINIVLREGFVKRSNEGRLIAGWEQGRWQPSAGVQHNGGDAGFNYNVGLNYNHRDLGSDVTTTTTAKQASGAAVLDRTEHEAGQTTSDGVHMVSRLNWRLDGGDSLTVQPFMVHWRSNSLTTATLDQSLGAEPPRYARAATDSSSGNTIARIMGQWRGRVGDGRLELRLNASHSDGDSDSRRREFDSGGAFVHEQIDASSTRDTGLSTGGKYSRPLATAHQLAFGWDAEFGNRREGNRITQDGVDVLASLGDEAVVRTRRLAVFAQDEWEVTPLWAVYGGLRWETIRTRSGTPGATIDNDSRVASPLFQSLWRFSEASKDQVRLALTRSYRSPTLGNLTATPTLSASYPVSGTNTATSPDTIGNPQLRPELAWGLDLAYEHYLGAGGMVSASLFRRDIDDLIRSVIRRQPVTWSAQPRWVAMPENIGKAVSEGIELEAKLRLDEVLAEAPRVDLRVNYSRFRSSVSGVAGPDNRLDQQPEQTANLGADYRLPGTAVTIGGNVNWTPAYAVRQTDTQWVYLGIKRVVEAYALWRVDGNMSIRFSASNLLHDDYQTASRMVVDGIDQMAVTDRQTYRSFAVRLETKF